MNHLLPTPPQLEWKTPDRKACPCCQASALRYAKPECEQTHVDGKLASFALYWRCSRCGCRWMDGQEVPQPGEVVAFLPDDKLIKCDVCGRPMTGRPMRVCPKR